MAEKIKLVQGDTLPNVNLTLTDPDSGDAIDLSDPAINVNVYFRAVGSTEVLSTIGCIKVDATNGKVRFNFDNGVLDVPSGPYEGEIEIDFDGAKQTIYEKLKFFVREDFA